MVQSVVWVIDAMYFLGHTGCAYCFNIKQQPRLLRLNSQICEQRVGHSLKGAMSVLLLAFRMKNQMRPVCWHALDFPQ